MESITQEAMDLSRVLSLNKEVYMYKITVRLAIEHTIWQKQIRNIETMVIRKEEDTASTYVYK